jgi:hypothetical protein
VLIDGRLSRSACRTHSRDRPSIAPVIQAQVAPQAHRRQAGLYRFAECQCPPAHSVRGLPCSPQLLDAGVIDNAQQVVAQKSPVGSRLNPAPSLICAGSRPGPSGYSSQDATGLAAPGGSSARMCGAIAGPVSSLSLTGCSGTTSQREMGTTRRHRGIEIAQGAVNLGTTPHPAALGHRPYTVAEELPRRFRSSARDRACGAGRLAIGPHSDYRVLQTVVLTLTAR